MGSFFVEEALKPFYGRLCLQSGHSEDSIYEKSWTIDRKIIIDELIIVLLSGLEKFPRESVVP
jgi:hypothetical protein